MPCRPSSTATPRLSPSRLSKSNSLPCLCPGFRISNRRNQCSDACSSICGYLGLGYEGGSWKLDHGQIAVVSSNQVTQTQNYASVWRISDTVTTGAGQGQVYVFDILMYQSGTQLLGLSDQLILDGMVNGNRIDMEFVQLDTGYKARSVGRWTRQRMASGRSRHFNSTVGQVVSKAFSS